LPDAALHPTAKQTNEYLESFADRFGLRKHVRLSTTVTNITRNEENNTWVITTKPTNSQRGTDSTEFDRLILCTGPHGKAVMPKLFQNPFPFEGEVTHSRHFKNPSRYKDKTVVVVGTSATAVDTTEFCRAAGAKKVYISHRRAIRLVIPRHCIWDRVNWLTTATASTRLPRPPHRRRAHSSPGAHRIVPARHLTRPL
jgi:dimethylaniline monooxygenase (N-oxide forming)